MPFKPGDHIVFRYTGETGVITTQLDDGIFQVRLDDDPSMEIPAFEEDMLPEGAIRPVTPTPKGYKKEEPPQPPPKREIKSQYLVLKPKGIQIAFEPMPGLDNSASRFKIWLINDSAFEFLFTFALFDNNDTLLLESDGKINNMSAKELGDMALDQLNIAPEIELEVRRISTQGAEPPLFKLLKLKPKVFFNKINTAPILNVLAHHFVVINQFEPEPDGSNAPKTDIREYTRLQMGQQAVNRQNARKSNVQRYRQYDIEEFSVFVPEIDLHAEALNPAYAKMPKGEILRLQIQHCDRFLDKAIRLGVHTVYLVHGLGEGKLKEAIARLLKDRPEVISFDNAYHHKYGYGATEVRLK